MGFSLDQIRTLLRLWSDTGRSNAEVKAVALEHVRELELKAAQLREMAEILQHLADACDASGRPDCPIIRGLEGEIDLPAPRASANCR